MSCNKFIQSKTYTTPQARPIQLSGGRGVCEASARLSLQDYEYDTIQEWND